MYIIKFIGYLAISIIYGLINYRYIKNYEKHTLIRRRYRYRPLIAAYFITWGFGIFLLGDVPMNQVFTFIIIQVLLLNYLIFEITAKLAINNYNRNSDETIISEIKYQILIARISIIFLSIVIAFQYGSFWIRK